MITEYKKLLLNNTSKTLKDLIKFIGDQLEDLKQNKFLNLYELFDKGLARLKNVSNVHPDLRVREDKNFFKLGFIRKNGVEMFSILECEQDSSEDIVLVKYIPYASSSDYSDIDDSTQIVDINN